jgi:hydrogenase expression/formation protein HypE
VRVAPAIGEDACAIDVPSGALVVATDPVTLTGRGVGRLAVVVNANDVAVMGARPRWFLACVLLPLGTTEEDVASLFGELRGALARVGAALVGGHTEITDVVSRPVLVGQMLGLRTDGAVVATAGMQAGDVLLQVGPAPIEGAAVLAGEAAARLRGVDPALLARAEAAIDLPGISVVEPALRAAELGASAMHDPTEGGLSAGLHELAQASGLALRVDPDAVLWFEPGRALAEALGADPWGVLASGTLLAAFPPDGAEAASRALAARGHAVSAIGRAEPGRGVHTPAGPLRRYEQDELSRVLAR